MRWKGLAFPGGHVDGGESVYECAVREVKEETGLDVRDLKPCGMMHWCCGDTGDRYFVFLYKTSRFSGELIPEMEEGRHSWMTVDELWRRQEGFTPRFEKYLSEMFFGSRSEAFCLYRGDSADYELDYF
ncbi:MAG: NUDIX domain-containing protein [Oscillospiraceae bacterium]|nr:NUDIX domain-containing protein [Oscillospiraceae bacterium]